MSISLVKTGGASILLGEREYRGYFNVKYNMLLKITKVSKRHDECKYIEEIRKIPDYEKYYAIPENKCFLLRPHDHFYEYLEKLVEMEKMPIFGGDLHAFFVNYAGKEDLQDSIAYLNDNHFSPIWNNYSNIMNFITQIIDAIRFLHDRKICHLDIKPENIMINDEKKQFRLIDFGFSSKEPFNDYVFDLRGTPGYFPKQYNFDNSTKFLPKIEANDFILVNNELPIVKNRKLVYKIDSYCLGRILYFLTYIFDENYIPNCFNWYGKTEKRVKNIMNDLLENDVQKRITIQECYEKYFS